MKDSEAEQLDKCYSRDKNQMQWEKREEVADSEEAQIAETSLTDGRDFDSRTHDLLCD